MNKLRQELQPTGKEPKTKTEFDAQQDLDELLAKANQYKKECNLTNEFFCKKSDDMQLIFETYNTEIINAENKKEVIVHTKPCCKTGIDRQSLIEKRKGVWHQFQLIQKRIIKFREMLDNILSKSATDQEALTQYLIFGDEKEGEQPDNEIFNRINELDSIVNSIDVQLHHCKEQNFSEDYKSLQRLDYVMCEPVEKILEQLQEAFYPRMFYIEKRFALAETNLNIQKNANKNVIQKFFEKLYGVIQRTGQALSNIFSILLTGTRNQFREYVTGVLSFAEHETDESTKITENTFFTDFFWPICELLRDIEDKDEPKTQLKVTYFYAYLYILIDDNVKKEPDLYQIMRNRFRKFCSDLPEVFAWILDFVPYVVPNISKEYAIKKELDTLIEKNVEKTKKQTCKLIDDLNDDGLDEDVVAFLFFAICIIAIELIHDLLVQVNGNEFITLFPNEEDEKTVANQKQDKLRKLMNPIPPKSVLFEKGTDRRDFENAQKEHIILEEESFDLKENYLFLKQYFQNPDVVFKQIEGTRYHHYAANIIETTFNYFWFNIRQEFLVINETEKRLYNDYKEKGYPEKEFDGNVTYPVENHVLLAYCMAQHNSAEDCYREIVENGIPSAIEGLGNTAKRYKDAKNMQKLESEDQRIRELDRLWQPESVINEQVTNAIDQVRTELPQYKDNIELNTKPKRDPFLDSISKEIQERELNIQQLQAKVRELEASLPRANVVQPTSKIPAPSAVPISLQQPFQPFSQQPFSQQPFSQPKVPQKKIPAFLLNQPLGKLF